MKIIVDTNITFSALLNSKSTIGEIIFNSPNLEFYSCNYMQFEIQKHWERLKFISKLSDEQLNVSYQQILLRIKFINEAEIPVEIWMDSERLIKEIDINDVDFLALTKFLKGKLWTGDKVLYNGLKKLEFEELLNTTELLKFKS